MRTSLLRGALAATLGLAGCESVVPVDLPTHTPQLSVSYTLSNQAPPTGERDFFDGRSLYVSTSQDVGNINRLAGRADATVELHDAAGQVVEQFRPRGRGGYGSTDSTQGYYVPVRRYVGQPGQRYTLRASAPGVEAVSAALTLPAAPTIESGSYALDPAQPNYQYRGRLTFNIRDNAATTDYYLAYARVLDATGGPIGTVQQEYGDRNNAELAIKLTRLDLSWPGYLYQMLPLSDAGRQGQRLNYSSDVYLSGNFRGNSASTTPAFIEIIVSSIPAETYEFYQSIQRFYDTEGNPFAEPAPVRSNIRGGYGLFGGATDATFRIKL
jgi:hypothetical protein